MGMYRRTPARADLARRLLEHIAPSTADMDYGPFCRERLTDFLAQSSAPTGHQN